MNIDNYLKNIEKVDNLNEGAFVIWSSLNALSKLVQRILEYRNGIKAVKNLINNAEPINDFTEDIKKITGFDFTDKILIDRTLQLNAYADTNSKVIFVSQGLLDELKYEEVLAIILHEIGHIEKNDVKVRFLSGMFGTIALDILTIVISSYFSKYKAIASLLIGSYMASSWKTWREGKVTKLQEYAADSYAAKKGYGPQLISGLKKIEKNQLQDVIREQKIDLKQAEEFLSKNIKAANYPQFKERFDAILKNKEVKNEVR